jgi:polyhydroxybutyrate depolymerase
MRCSGFVVATMIATAACGSRDTTPKSGPVSKSDTVDPAGDADQGTARDPSRVGASTSGDTTASGTVTGVPPVAPQMIVTTETVTVLGVPRTFVLAAPSTYAAATAYPLVLVLHGDGGDGASMRGAAPFDDVSAQNAFVAYPTGSNNGWDLYTPMDRNADAQFIVALVASLSPRFNVDPGRVFATGFSSGAFMVNQMACRRPGLFRGIAPQSGGAPSEPQDPAASLWGEGFTHCAGQTMGSGPAAMVVHGTVDGTVVYESGEHTANYWAFVNGCATTRSADATPECVRHDACPNGKPVVFCPIANLGHSLWGSASTAMWSFFKSL